MTATFLLVVTVLGFVAFQVRERMVEEEEDRFRIAARKRRRRREKRALKEQEMQEMTSLSKPENGEHDEEENGRSSPVHHKDDPLRPPADIE